MSYRPTAISALNRGCCLAAALVLLLAFSSKGYTARMKIEKMDYAASWQVYLEQDSFLEPAMSYPYEACFKEAAWKNNVPVTLLLALARGESDFNPRAKSSRACYGIMQIQWPGTARDLGLTSIQDLYDPCKNIQAGARYLGWLFKRYKGNVHLALAAYNYGPGRISRNKAIPEGAVWYSGYIFHHLSQVLARVQPASTIKKKTKKPYRPGNKIPVILFHNPFKARNFIIYFKPRAPEVRLDWFRTQLGETYISLVFDTPAEKQKSMAKMEALGFKLRPEKIFR